MRGYVCAGSGEQIPVYKVKILAVLTVSAISALGQQNPHAPGAPYQADYIQTHRTLRASGEVVRESVVKATEYRDSLGSVMRVDEAGGCGRYFDNVAHVDYQIDHTRKRVVAVPRTEAQLAMAEKLSAPGAMGPPLRKEVLGGESTSVFPVLDGATRKQVGTVWYSDRWNVLVRREVLYDDGDTRQLQIIERTNIVSVEPNPVLFRIPAGYTIQIAGCASCSGSQASATRAR